MQLRTVYPLAIILAVSICIAVGNCGVCVGQTQPKQDVQTKGTSTSNNSGSLFPIVVAQPTAKPGELVLCPSRQFYDSAVEKGVDKTTFIYYAAKMIEVGNVESKVTNLAGRTFLIPNQLIISIPPHQKCNTGDVILTWWQTGSGMQRAIVVGGSETEPIVRYLDISLDNPSGAGKREDTLKPGSFYVLNKEWQIGSAVAIDSGRQTRHGLLLATSDQHVLVREFAGKLKCYERTKARPVPIVPDVEKGEIAMASLYGSFKPVTVTKVDSKIGRVFATFQLGRKDQEKVFAFGDVFKK